jgi:hypothetical protein
MPRLQLATAFLLILAAGCKTSGTGSSPQETPPGYKPGDHKFGFTWLDNDDKWDHVDGLPLDMRNYDGAD